MPEILFPILTASSLVFAGILVGYFLWFRDRSEQLILNEHLATENERLKLELRGTHSQNQEVETNVERLELKNASLQQLCDDLLKTREKIQLHASDLESELNSVRKKLDESRDQLTTECRKRTEVEESLMAEKQHALDSKTDLEKQWQTRLDETQSNFNRTSSELKQQVAINHQLEQRLQALTTDNLELKSEMASHKEILEAAKNNAQGLEKEYVSLETNLRSQHELLDESRGQTAAALSAKELAEAALAESKQQVAHLTTRVEELDSESRSKDRLQARCENLESALQLAKERMESTVAQRDDFGVRFEESERELIGLRNRSRNQQLTIEKLRAQANEIDQQRQQNQQQLLGQIKIMETENKELRSVAEKSEKQLQQDKVENSKRLQILEDEISDLRNQAGEIEEQRLQNQTELLDKIRNLESRNNELQRDANRLQKTRDIQHDAMRRLELLKSENSEMLQEHENLNAKYNELEQVKQQAESVSQEYKSRIQSVLNQRDQAYSELTQVKDELKRIQLHAKSNEETIRTLRRERGAILMRNRAYANQSFPRIHPASLEFSKADQLSAEYGGTIQSDPVRGPVFVEPPREKDDLKKIYGVAKVLEEKLNEFGIYTFRQIMDWDDKAISEFSELLVFKDRIQRDDWVGQATKLYRQKSSSKAA